jgi:hypothetical protein
MGHGAKAPNARQRVRRRRALKLSNARNVTPIHAAVGEAPGRGRPVVADSQFRGLNTLAVEQATVLAVAELESLDVVRRPVRRIRDVETSSPPRST